MSKTKKTEKPWNTEQWNEAVEQYRKVNERSWTKEEYIQALENGDPTPFPTTVELVEGFEEYMKRHPEIRRKNTRELNQMNSRMASEFIIFKGQMKDWLAKHGKGTKGMFLLEFEYGFVRSKCTITSMDKEHQQAEYKFEL